MKRGIGGVGTSKSVTSDKNGRVIVERRGVSQKYTRIPKKSRGRQKIKKNTGGVQRVQA